MMQKTWKNIARVTMKDVQSMRRNAEQKEAAIRKDEMKRAAAATAQKSNSRRQAERRHEQKAVIAERAGYGFKITITAAILAIAVIGSTGLFLVSTPDIARTVDVDLADARKAVSVCEQMIDSFARDPERFEAICARFDDIGFSDLRELLDGIRVTSFEKAHVCSPVFNADIFYVYVPVDAGKKLHIVLRTLEGTLSPISVSRIE